MITRTRNLFPRNLESARGKAMLMDKSDQKSDNQDCKD